MIGTCLRAIADYVDDRATTSWDPHHRPSPEQEAAKAGKIRAVARELRVLADEAGTRALRYGEYQALKDRLHAFGCSLTPKLEQDIAAAFHDARGPVKAREKGWLHQP